MTRNVHLDDSELRNLEIDISKAPLRLQFNTRAAMGKAARVVRGQMRLDAAGHRHLSHLPTAVTESVYGNWEAEIGLAPQKGTQGALAHIIVYGSVNNAPVYDHTAGLRRAEPRILEIFADAAEESVLGKDRS